MGLSSFARSVIERAVSSQTALLAEQQRAFRRALSLPLVVDTALRTRVGTTPHDVVFTSGTLRVLRYHRQTPALYAEPVIFCYALVNRPYILDLQPDKSVVRKYLERGFDVYLIDWGVPTYRDRALTLEDYVCQRLASVIDFVRSQHPAERVHLLGYCMGGTLSAMYTALHPEHVQTLTLLATPIDFSGQESLLKVWTDPRYFDVDALIDAHGNCPAPLLQLSFLNMKPVQNFLEKYIGFYEQMDDPRFLSNYFAMERWVNDNIPVAGETFREFVKKLYQSNELVRGVFHLGQRHVELRRITCPLLALTATNDHLVAPASTNGIRPHVGSAEVEQMTIDAGHVGLVVSGKAHKTLWPEATRWLMEHSSAPERTRREGRSPGAN
ncbi:MAG TPA: class III poly(R)-hydroxyalkanoic acid synthase subunit PhaC [Polyangiaceae bacterium]|nr:class III poly(R)-hydroxyalkanoic acid synthase subunit PhaC [Polyangiaceae bacterium]